MYLYTMYSKELIKGTLKTIILKLLEENSRMYGYEITQKVKELSDSKILIKEGSLYPALHKLVDDGMLETEKEMIGKRVRVYYKLTTEGKKETKNKLEELQEFIQTISLIIQPTKAFTKTI